MLFIRKTEHSDIKIYFNWANDKIVRDNSFHNEPIFWETHRRWFKRKLGDENSYLYVVEDAATQLAKYVLI